MWSRSSCAWPRPAALQTAAGDDPEGGSENSQLAFIGELGVYLGAFNLLLVVAEGVMVPVLFNHG